MGLIGIPRSEVSEAIRRRYYLKHAQEVGFKTTNVLGKEPEPDLYGDDIEARMYYLRGARLGKRERDRG